VKSPCNTTGYYKQPELTKELFTDDGYVKTGDQGEIDALRQPAHHRPREGALQDLEGQVRRAVAHRKQKVKMAAHKHERDHFSKALEELRVAVNDTLDPHEQLACCVVVTAAWTVENNIVTPTLKIKRNELEKHYAPRLLQWQKGKGVIWEG
jgi:long-chain acyl-CoA synthetase